MEDITKYQPIKKFKIGNGVLMIHKPYSVPFIEKWKINWFMIIPYLDKHLCFKDFDFTFGKYIISYREHLDLNNSDKCYFCLCDPADCCEDYYEEHDENERIKQCYHEQLKYWKEKEKQ